MCTRRTCNKVIFYGFGFAAALSGMVFHYINEAAQYIHYPSPSPNIASFTGESMKMYTQVDIHEGASINFDENNLVQYGSFPPMRVLEGVDNLGNTVTAEQVISYLMQLAGVDGLHEHVE